MVTSVVMSTSVVICQHHPVGLEKLLLLLIDDQRAKDRENPTATVTYQYFKRNLLLQAGPLRTPREPEHWGHTVLIQPVLVVEVH